MLYALGITAEIHAMEDELFALLVPAGSAGIARAHLAAAEAEAAARRAELTPKPLRFHRYSWLGCAGYALVLLAVAHCDDRYVFGRDWYALGALQGTVPATGEWWRSVTALMLHADLGHLLANLCFGVFFGFFAGQMVGAGLAWAGTLLAAMIGNLIDIALMPRYQVSLGASTAVFATLGLVSAYSWRKHDNPRAKWAYRTAPLVAGIALLAMTGSGDGSDRTDVVAHLGGFAAGVLVGIAYAVSALPERVGWRIQCAGALLTLLGIVCAWWLALF